MCISNWSLRHNKTGTEINLNLKSVMIIDPVTGWFEITQYNDKRVISIPYLFEIMRLSRYPIPTEVTYDQGSKIIGHEFIKSLIER